MAIALQTKFVKNGSDTIVTFIGIEMRDGVERARFQASHGGIVSLTMTTFLERYSEYVEPCSEKTPMDLAFEKFRLTVKPDGRILDHAGCAVNCPSELVELYLEQFPLLPEFTTGDGLHEVFMEYRPHSCMGYDNDDCHEMRNLYCNNSDQVSVAYFKPESNYLMSGATSCLIWHTKCGHLWIDRIYKDGFRSLDFENTLRLHLKRIAEAQWPGLTFAKPSYIDLEHDPEMPLPYIDTFYNAEDIGNCVVRLRDHSTRNTTVCRCTNGVVLVGSVTCCNCNERLDPEDHRSNDSGDTYCDSCWDDNYTYDELSDCYVSNDDINSYEVYRSGRIRTVYTTEDGISYNHTRCHDDSCAEWVHDDDRIETSDGEYICMEDMENGDWVETVEGDVMPVGDAYYYDDEYHTDEQETPDDMPEDDSDDSDDEPMAIDPDQIFVTIKCDDGSHSMPATKIGDCLAVHLKYNTSSRDAIKWQVSHIPTGLAVYGNLDSRQDAIDAATKLLASLAIGGIANGMLTTVDPNRVDPVGCLASATNLGIHDRIVSRIYRNLNQSIDYSVLATV
jgi:hypothetical protein